MVTNDPRNTADSHNKEHEDDADAKRVILVNASGFVTKSVQLEENRLGSECSGSDGATGRIITLSNTSESGSPTSCWVENQLISQTDYTINHLSSNSTLTFNINIFDLDNLIIRYYI